VGALAILDVARRHLEMQYTYSELCASKPNPQDPKCR
jgi:hypothetical protein